MNEIILNGIPVPTEEFITRLTELCIFCMTISIAVLYISKEIALAFVEIVKHLKNYLKRKKRKFTYNSLPEYTVEKADGLGVIYKNNAELVLVCNSYQNALCIKEILEDDDLLDMPFAGKEEEHE